MTGPPLVGAGQRSSTRTAFALQDDARDVPPLGSAGAGVGVGDGEVVGEPDGVDVALDEVEGCEEDDDTEDGRECEALRFDGPVCTAVTCGVNTEPVRPVSEVPPCDPGVPLCAFDELVVDVWGALELAWCAGGDPEECGAECPGALDVPSESDAASAGPAPGCSRPMTAATPTPKSSRHATSPARTRRRRSAGSASASGSAGAATAAPTKAPRDRVCSEASATGATPAGPLRVEGVSTAGTVDGLAGRAEHVRQSGAELLGRRRPTCGVLGHRLGEQRGQDR